MRKKILNNKVLLMVFSVLTTILLVAGATYAWFVWNSPNSTNMTMAIGESTIVTFEKGNNISGDMYPVYNFTDGRSTTFTLDNSYNTLGKRIVVHPYLDITALPTQLKLSTFKYVLADSSDNIIDQGNFSTYNAGDIVALEPFALSSGESSYTFYIYIDGNEQNNPNMIGQTFTGTLRIEALAEEIPANPITDYEYTLFDKEDTELSEDYILLRRYIGTSSTVIVPNSFTVDGKTYNTVLLLNFTYPGASMNKGVFMNNTDITFVTLPSNYLISKSDSSLSLFSTYMDAMFLGCTSLVGISHIPNTVTGLSATFYNCSSLTDVPEIPYGIINMGSTFYNCSSLTEAPSLPNSVTSMGSTFAGCTSLTEVSALPNSVTFLASTFQNCSSLTEAPVIPSTVTSMLSTFENCTSLTGTVRINSSNVTSSWNSNAPGHPFYGTVNNITVEVPAGSTAYTSLNTNKPANITVTTFTP